MEEGRREDSRVAPQVEAMMDCLRQRNRDDPQDVYMVGQITQSLGC